MSKSIWHSFVLPPSAYGDTVSEQIDPWDPDNRKNSSATFCPLVGCLKSLEFPFPGLASKNRSRRKTVVFHTHQQSANRKFSCRFRITSARRSRQRSPHFLGARNTDRSVSSFQTHSVFGMLRYLETVSPHASKESRQVTKSAPVTQILGNRVGLCGTFCPFWGVSQGLVRSSNGCFCVF